MIKQISIKTKFGWISAFESKGKIFRIKFGKLKEQKKSKILNTFKKSLISYFNKRTKEIRSPYKLIGNSTQKKVWKDLKNIKFGKIKTYGAIAKKNKLSPRHVGKICSQNNLLLLVPCHRVIKTDGTLGGFSSTGGVKLKKKLLNFEKN